MSQRWKRLQTNLKREGFDPGKIDGANGPKTSDAMKRFIAFKASTPNGIDVSRWNPEIDFDEIATGSEACEFIYVKATEGNFRDALFSRNWSEAKRVGLLRGAYHFFRPGVSLDVQAKVIFDAVGVLAAGDLPVAIDVERDDKGADGKLGTGDDIKATDAQVEELANKVANLTGRRPLIYSYSYYLDDRNIEVPTCLYWGADYREGPPNVPPGWVKATFHQYEVGSQNGVKGPVDRNYFNGTLAELRALAGL